MKFRAAKRQFEHVDLLFNQHPQVQTNIDAPEVSQRRFLCPFETPQGEVVQTEASMPETPVQIPECDCSTGSLLDFPHNILLRVFLESRRVEIHNNTVR